MRIIERNKLDAEILDSLKGMTKEVVFHDIKYLVYSGDQ